jgi:hypothetical protein
MLVLDFAGVKAHTDLSYYQKLTNTYRIHFEFGCITGVSGEEHRFTLERAGRKPQIVRLPRGRISNLGHATQMMTNFVSAVSGNNKPLVTGRDVLRSIKAISKAYRSAQVFDAPWLPRFA